MKTLFVSFGLSVLLLAPLAGHADATRVKGQLENHCDPDHPGNGCDWDIYGSKNDLREFKSAHRQEKGLKRELRLSKASDIIGDTHEDGIYRLNYGRPIEQLGHYFWGDAAKNSPPALLSTLYRAAGIHRMIDDVEDIFGVRLGDDTLIDSEQYRESVSALSPLPANWFTESASFKNQCVAKIAFGGDQTDCHQHSAFGSALSNLIGTAMGGPSHGVASEDSTSCTTTRLIYVLTRDDSRAPSRHRLHMFYVDGEADAPGMPLYQGGIASRASDGAKAQSRRLEEALGSLPQCPGSGVLRKKNFWDNFAGSSVDEDAPVKSIAGSTPAPRPASAPSAPAAPASTAPAS